MKNSFAAANRQAARWLAGAGISALAVTLAVPAMAQDAEAGQDDETVILEDGQEATAATGPILVTGSRIRRTEATSASPLTIIDPTLQQKQGLNSTAEIIQQSPIANGSTQITAAISANTISNGGAGAQTISLRGLGAERTLVLLNSRRAGPAGTRGAVASFDLNVLPSVIIQQVDILKDGASSIYGSDAVAGVVNIQTKRATDGLEFNFFRSQPFEDGGQETSASVAWGTEFDRGHILFAADYYHQKELKRRDRDFLGCPEDYVFSEDGERRLDNIDPRTGEIACNGGTLWGHIWTYSSSNLPDQDPDFFNPSGVSLLQFSYGNDNLGAYLPGNGPAVNIGDVIAPPGWFVVAYETPLADALANAYHPFEQKSTVIPKTDRFTLYADGSFDITDDIEFFAEGLFNRRKTYIDSYSQFYNFGYTNIYAPDDPDNPFPGWRGIEGELVPGDPRTFIPGAFISPTGILDQYDNWLEVDYYRGVAGLRGDITDKLQFDITGQYSISKGKYTFQQILNDSITQQTDRAYGYGCAGLFTAIEGKPCLQMNWVDPRVMAGDLTQAEIDYLIGEETGRTEYEQKYLEASVSGDLFELPGGPVGFALGGVIRGDKIDDMPGDITYALVPGGDPDNPDDYVDNAFANPFGGGPTAGRSVTKELFGEINLPLLADKPFFQELTFSAAARVTNVKATRASDGASDSINGNWTYKLMGNWQVTDWLRLRSTYGTSFRAPALFEQFLGNQTSGVSQRNADPCVQWAQGLAEGTITQRIADNCAADQTIFGGPATGIAPNHRGAGIQATVISRGGFGRLEPETSQAFTASVILTPKFSFLPDTDIALTVDYFDIKVENEISQLTPFQILYNCYDAVDFPNNEYCGFFERGQDGNISNLSDIRREFINVDEQVNRGIDFTLRVRHDFGNMGKLAILGQATLQTKDTVNTLGVIEEFNGEVGDPRFTGNVVTTWEKGNTTLLYGITVIGKSSSVSDYIEDFGSVCNPTPTNEPIYGEPYCVQPFTKAVWYHNASITQVIDERFEITLGMSNIFDTEPPQVSGLVTPFANVPLASQYDFLGRRAFVQAKAKF